MALVKYSVLSSDEISTELIGFELGSKLRGGEIIELSGDIGNGKTTFVKGLARGIGSSDLVTSPTFTISQIYNSPKLSMHHYDFYRLEDVRIIRKELLEVLEDPTNVVVLEWVGSIHDILPHDCIRIKIEVRDIDKRELIFTIPKKFNYLNGKFSDDTDDQNR